MFSTERLTGLIGGREHALCCSGHGDGATACTGKRKATWRPRVAPPPQKLPASARRVTIDGGARPNECAALWIRRGNREQGATAVTGEIDVRF